MDSYVRSNTLTVNVSFTHNGLFSNALPRNMDIQCIHIHSDFVHWSSDSCKYYWQKRLSFGNSGGHCPSFQSRAVVECKDEKIVMILTGHFNNTVLLLSVKPYQQKICHLFSSHVWLDFCNTFLCQTFILT